jgi:uncharacterized protein YndB with AHSA1/START domain
MTAGADLSRIERSIFIRAPRSRVWRAITDVAEFSAWFQVKAEGEFAPHARLRMTTTHPAYAGIVFYVTVEDVKPEHSFSWQWHPGSAPAESGEPTTLVEFHLAEEANGTRVTVTETGFDRISLARRAKAFAENTQGWEEQLAALSRYLGHEA